jgi:hypothetical protein
MADSLCHIQAQPHAVGMVDVGPGLARYEK